MREVIGSDEASARRALRRLVQAGLIARSGQRGGATYAIVERIAPPAAYRLSTDELANLVLVEARRGELSNERVRSITGLKRDQALSLLRRLVNEGRLRVSGSRRGTRYHIGDEKRSFSDVL